MPELIKGVTAAFGGITVEAFDAAVREFFAAARHPTLGVPYTEVAFRPDARADRRCSRPTTSAVYICSAGGRDFVRAVSEQVYGIPRERVIGSATTLEYRDGDLYRTTGSSSRSTTAPASRSTSGPAPGASPCSPAATPTATSPMLETARFALLIHHDDAEREFAYDVGAEQALAAAGARDWTVVSMKKDFTTVF